MQRSSPLSYVVISCHCICDGLVVTLARAQRQSASLACTGSSIVHTHVHMFPHTQKLRELKKKGSLSNAKAPPVGNSKALTHTHSSNHATQGKSVCPGHQPFLRSNLPVGRCWQRSSPTWLLLNVLCCPNAILIHCCHDCTFVGHGMANWVAVNRMESS